MQYTDFVLLPPHITEILGSCPTHPHYAMLPSPLQNHCYIDIREGFLSFPTGKIKKKYRVNCFKSLHHTQINVRQQ